MRTLDPARLETAITPRTKAIVPVHLYGMPAAMAPILAIAAKHGIPVIEDAAQAHGATYQGKRVGQFGCTACFSFYPGKNLGAYGEGGALVTNDDAQAQRARSLRNHGQSQQYHHDEIGYNYRMDSFQGAVLRIKLKHLEAGNAARAAHARRYAELLEGSGVTVPPTFADSQTVWHCYVIETDRRDEMWQRLSDAGIDTRLHYPVPLHLQKVYASLGYKRGDFPVAERLSERCLSLPMFPEMTDLQIKYVCDNIRAKRS